MYESRYMELRDLLESFLNQNNISMTSLYAVSVGFAIVFIFAVREFTVWFLKIHSLRRELRELQNDIQLLRRDLNAKKPVLPEVVPTPAIEAAPVVPKEPLFPEKNLSFSEGSSSDRFLL